MEIWKGGDGECAPIANDADVLDFALGSHCDVRYRLFVVFLFLSKMVIQHDAMRYVVN